MLLLVPRRIWLAVVVAACAGFVVYDLQAGLTLSSIAWFIPADLLEILIATLCLSHYFGGIPRLNRAKALTIFLVFAVILAPFTAAFVSAHGVASDYWTGWKICFFSEVLAFLTLTPAVFSWMSDGRAWLRKSRNFHLEAVALLTGLAFLSHIAFTASATASSPALLYALVPFLLWSALRFGSIGTSSAVIVVALLSIWGVVHGRGPFIEQGPFHSVRSIQLFLISTAIPFMVLAALAEERRDAEEVLKRREEELIEAQRVSQVGSWQWNPKTDEVAWSKELYRIAGRDPDLPPPALGEQTTLYTSEGWERLKCAVVEALRTGIPYTLDLEMLRPDGSTRWIIDRGEAVRDAAGRIAWLRGTAQDITERKQAEDQLRASEEKFRRVFRDAGVGMVIVSPDGRFLAANEAFCESLGYTEEELLQKTVQSITLPEDWPAFSKRLREALQRGTSFQRVEKRCLHKSGRIITTESSASLIRGPSGEPQYFVGEVLDITQRKLAEAALSLSHRLHSSKLELMGLVAAAAGICQELSTRQNVEIDFRSENIPNSLPKETSLCLFRVLQEALQNALKHSGQRRFDVTLKGVVNEIELTVHDSGVGFDPEKAIRGQGLGLTSMKERLKLVDGQLSVASTPQSGTTIHARVPLESLAKSARSVG